MAKPSKKLVSEQIPNDGGWHWGRLVDEANERLGKIGKHGKRAKIKVTFKPGNPISAQFSLPGIGQKSYGLDLPLSKRNLVKAEEYCQLITSQLVADTFTENWFYSLIGKKYKTLRQKPKKVLTCKEMLEQYKAHYFKQRKGNKTPESSWIVFYRHIDKILSKYDKPISLGIIREIIEETKNNTSNRTKHLNGLTNFLKYFNNTEFKEVIRRYKAENKPKPKNKHIPDDGEIMTIYNLGFEIHPNSQKRHHYRYGQWQFLYSLLAIYGLRVHEAWNIKNWDKPVILRDGDWLAVPDDKDIYNDDEEKRAYTYQQFHGKDLTIPAILDPDNKEYFLCIGHETKTGYRMAFPISPNGHDWIKEFNLLQPLNLPDIPNPLKRYGTKENTSFACTNNTSRWFRDKKYGFTPHALRHAYNIRGHKLSINQKMLADSLGHSLQMNGSNYLKHEGYHSKLQGMRQAIAEDQNKRNELDKLRAETQHLKSENEKLRAKVAMYEALLESHAHN